MHKETIQMKKIPTLLILLFTAVIFSLPLITKGQETGPDTPGDPPADDTPFDGGLSILVVTAVGYGITKMKRNKSTEDTIV